MQRPNDLTTQNACTKRGLPTNPSFFVKTFGCQMNVADSERMSVLLAGLGGKSVDAPEKADIVILNGCEVRDKAVQKMLSALGELKFGKSESKLIGVGGCVGQLDGRKLFRRNPHLDFVFGTDALDQLPEIIHEVAAGARHVVYNEFDKTRDYSTDTKVFHKSASAFVNIMKGCDKFCSFCIVPFTRGREKSRKIAELVSDIQRLALLGVREVTLLGQNVNSFGKGNGETFPELLRAIDREVPSLKRLRFTSSHPMDFSDELIACYGEVKSLCNQLHLPVQCGSNAVLEKMHRHYKIERYYEQIQKWRSRCPQGSLSTDIIVGFPTETDEDFEATMKLLEDLRFDQVFAFAYSSRPGTKAAKLKDDVPAPIKHARLLRFQKRALEISTENNQRFVGQRVEVLVEGKARPLKNSKAEVIYTGRTSCGRVVNVPVEGGLSCGSPHGTHSGAALPDLTGRFIEVEIAFATGLALTGSLRTTLV